ncbi:hypothetical protein CBER1_10062 [Cercospora berteroae]|uniref:Uncharacterized protein n=1 Tax=Cercospora berteroae TaxID=357750 RepID=A0A2S6BV51_9PEZI|nr:hypothetical protein CBER1_10062 [Cercospora berteroae]
MTDSQLQNKSTEDEEYPFWDKRCQFSKIQRYKQSSLKMHRLTNPISEIFAKHLFAIEDNKERTAISDQTYAKLASSLKLASQMIYSPLLVPFWSALLLKQPSYWENRDNPNEYGMQFTFDQFDPARPWSDEVRRATEDQVHSLHRYVKYVITDRTDSFCTEQQGSHHEYAPDVPKGYSSEIWIGTKKINQLIAATVNSGDVPALLVCRFRLALGLLHELAHAAWNKVNGKIDFEPFFGNELVSELGFELERQLFDGCLDILYDSLRSEEASNDLKVHRYSGRTSALVGFPALWEHPSQDNIEDYRGMSCLQVRKEVKEKQKYDLVWQVSLNHFEKFFKDSFWESEECYDRKNWHPPREVGYTVRRIVQEPQEAKDGKEAKEGRNVTEPVALAADEERYLFKFRGCNYERGAYGEIILPSHLPKPVADLTRWNYGHAASEDPRKLPWHSPRKEVELYTGLTDRAISLHKRKDLLSKLHLAVLEKPVDLAKFEGDAMDYRTNTRMVPLLEYIVELEQYYNRKKNDYRRMPGSPLLKRPGQSAVDVEVLVSLLRDLEKIRIDGLKEDARWEASYEERRKIFEEPEIDGTKSPPMELVQITTPHWRRKMLSPEHGPTPSPLTPAAQKQSDQRQILAQDLSFESARKFLFPREPTSRQSVPSTPQGSPLAVAGMKYGITNDPFTSTYHQSFTPSQHKSGMAFQPAGYTLPSPGTFSKVASQASISKYVPPGPLTPQRRPRALPYSTPGLTPDSVRSPRRTEQVPVGLRSVLHRNKRMKIGRGSGLTTAQEEDEDGDDSPRRLRRRKEKRQSEEEEDVEMEDAAMNDD